MPYDFNNVTLADAHGWFDLLIARINKRFPKKYYSLLTDLPSNDQDKVALGMQDFMIYEVGFRIGLDPRAVPAVAVPTLDEIARAALALPKKDKHRLYQLLYNDGCRINR